MKTIIGKQIIAGIFLVTLLAVAHSLPNLTQRYLTYRSEKLTQVQYVQEMPDGSYSNLVNTLLSSTWR